MSKTTKKQTIDANGDIVDILEAPTQIEEVANIK